MTKTMFGLDARDMKLRWLFVFAHLDDETILAGGTIAKLAEAGNAIRVVVCCGAGRRSATESQQLKRMRAFEKTMDELGVERIAMPDSFDLELTRETIDAVAASEIARFKPDVVATHSVASLHRDHRLVAEQMLVACRRINGSSVRVLLAACSPADSHAYGQFGSF